MRLPASDDPGGDREGALPRDIVLIALREHGVSIRSLGGDLYLLAEGGVFEVQSLTDPVGGVIVRRLARKFRIHILDFYYDPLTSARRVH